MWYMSNLLYNYRVTSQTSQENHEETLRRRNRELSILNSIAEALNRSVDLEQALQAALVQAAELLGLHTGWVWLLHEESGETYLAAAQNLPPGLENHPELMRGSCYCLDTYRAGDLDGAANVNVILCSRLKKLVDGTGGLRYHASIPLYAHGKSLGVLNLASADWRELTSDDLRLLYTLGDLLSIAIERARLYARSVEFGATAERIRLAREIHDTLAQGLAGIALHLETADAQLEAQLEPERVRRTISQALALTRANLDEARRSVLDLRSAPLEGRSLPEALQDLTRSITIASKTQITGDPFPLSSRLEIALYRIAQEALTNILRHASATKIRLELVYSPEQIRLLVEDNGVGFDPEHIPPGSFGLVGLNERIKMLNGSLKLESRPGRGTRIEAAIPLDGPDR
jgi:two-component system NarL family sensor kinase